MGSGTMAEWNAYFKARAMSEYDGTAEKERKRLAREERERNRELPGRAVVHRFMKRYQHHVAGMLAPCLRCDDSKHSEMCNALERLRTKGRK